MTDVRLYDRKAVLTIDTIEIEALRFAFNVQRKNTPEPNKAEIRAYNMNPDHRAQIEQLQTPAVQLEAGYRDGTSVIFLGGLRAGVTEREGPDLVTVLTSGDGETAFKTSRVNKSIASGAGVDEVLRTVATAVGVGAGNLDDACKKLRAAFGNRNPFPAGCVLSGSASREMTAICRTFGLEWSIQNGKLQILERGVSLAGQAISLSGSTGMIGAPTIDGKGVLSVAMALAPDVFPGRLLVLDGERLKGQFRIEECTYVGDTHAEPWQIDIRAQRY